MRKRRNTNEAYHGGHSIGIDMDIALNWLQERAWYLNGMTQKLYKQVDRNDMTTLFDDDELEEMMDFAEYAAKELERLIKEVRQNLGDLYKI